MRSAGMESLDIAEAGTFHAYHRDHQKHNSSFVSQKGSTEQWQLCSPHCTCSSRRRMVIRYIPRVDTELGTVPGSGQGEVESDSCDQVSWYYRQTTGAQQTPKYEFNKGFDFSTGADVSTLTRCGSLPHGGVCPVPDKIDTETVVPQPRIPEGCQLDNSDGGNPHDAREGSFCCSAELGYCSYRCRDTDANEVFSCPLASGDDQDVFPGGFDPCANWPKACYAIHYEDGETPEDGGAR